MRSLVYTVSMLTVPVFETFDFMVAQDMKAKGYTVSSRLLTRKTPISKEEKKLRTLHFGH